jgi:FKBP-type peptidyl-prolyl cis-trans isomerase 2
VADEKTQDTGTGVGEAVVRVVEGHLVELDYTIRLKDTGELVDTTIEEVGVSAGWTGRAYGTRVAVVGRGYLLRAIEEALIGMAENETKVIEIPPERAFGPRDPSKVKVIPLRRFKDLDQPLTVGMWVMVDGREGYIRSIESGRVQVDFNHRLAGKTLVAEIHLRRIILDDVEKVYSLIRAFLPEASRENTKVEVAKPEVTVRLGKEVYSAAGISTAKQAIARETLENIEGVEKVVFVEEYIKEQPTT